jgi:hypothetical protein
MTLEFWIRAGGTLFEIAGVAMLVFRFAKHRGVWAKLRRRIMRLIGRSQSFTLQAEGIAHSVTGGRAYLDVRPSADASAQNQINAIWRSVDSLRERINDSTEEQRAALAEVNRRISEEAQARQVSLELTKSQVTKIERGDAYDFFSVVCILLGIAVANMSQELACLFK